MNFLPIVERELRVSARRRGTHWGRFAVTMVLALGALSSLNTTSSAPPGLVARSVFTGLIGSAFVLACAACALTADALSGESREGTLGLLFLTDLRSWDVTFGKLVSSGLGAFYVVLALVPVLMLPVLAGGVGGPEAARSGLSLLTIILFSLAAGLAASARGHERWRALRRAGVWVAGTVLLPALVGLFVLGSWFANLSPITTLRLAQDMEYRAAPMMFWASLGLQLAHAAALLFAASIRLRRQIREPIIQAEPSRPSESEAGSSEPIYSVDAASNSSYLAVNPAARPRERIKEDKLLEWLITRQRGQGALCSFAALIFLLPSLAFPLAAVLSLRSAGGWSVGYYALGGASWVGQALLAWAACRFFIEARSSGELELLLTTPAGARDLVPAHWAAMKRLLRPPAMAVIALLLFPVVFAFLAIFATPSGGMMSYQLYYPCYALFRVADLILLALAVIWLGMLFGLTMRRFVTAVGSVLALTAVLPMLIHPVFQFVVQRFLHPSLGSSGWLVSMLIYFPVQWAYMLILIRWSHRRLRQHQPAELFQVDWVQTAKETSRRWMSAFRRLRWLTPGD